MGHIKKTTGFTDLAVLIATAILAFIFAFAPTAVAAEKTTTEEILDILKDTGQISDSKYEDLKERVKKEESPYELEVGGRILADWAVFSADDSLGDDLNGHGVEFRSARIVISGSFENNIMFKANYDFAGDGDADFKDVFIGMQKIPYLGNIKLGHFKEPFSLEEQTSSKYITFMERGLPNAFSPGRNTGAMIYNSGLDKRMSWALGAFYDTDSFGDGFNDHTDINLSGRITGAPLYKHNGQQAIHLGLSYTHQFRDEDETTLGYSSRPEAHLAEVSLADTGAIPADGANIFSLETAAVKGPFSLQGEYMHAFLDSDSGNDPDFNGYYVYASYFLTGESRNYNPGSGSFGRVKPNNDFSFQNGGFGAWELGLRYSSLDLTDQDLGDGELKDLTLGINWYLNSHVRMMCNYVFADLSDHAVYDDDQANILQTRLQVDF